MQAHLIGFPADGLQRGGQPRRQSAGALAIVGDPALIFFQPRSCINLITWVMGRAVVNMRFWVPPASGPQPFVTFGNTACHGETIRVCQRLMMIPLLFRIL